MAVAEGDNRDTPADVPLRIDVEHVKQGDVEQETRREADTIVGKAREHEPHDNRSVAHRRGWKNDGAPANARIGLDRQPHPKGDDDRDTVADEAVDARRLEYFAGKERAGDPRDECTNDERGGKLEALSGEE